MFYTSKRGKMNKFQKTIALLFIVMYNYSANKNSLHSYESKEFIYYE